MSVYWLCYVCMFPSRPTLRSKKMSQRLVIKICRKKLSYIYIYLFYWLCVSSRASRIIKYVILVDASSCNYMKVHLKGSVFTNTSRHKNLRPSGERVVFQIHRQISLSHNFQIPQWIIYLLLPATCDPLPAVTECSNTDLKYQK